MPDGSVFARDVRRNGLALELAAIDALRPDPPVNLLNWTIAHRIFPDDSPQPGAYRPETAPYLNEVLEACSPEGEAEEITVIKCAQSGGSVVAESFIAAVGSEVGGAGMIVHPTVKAAKDWNEEKFEPMAASTPRLSTDGPGGVIPRQAREMGGSKGDRIRFRDRGFFKLAGSNSAASLRQSSIRFIVLDDLDAFAADADGEGDPERLAFQRSKTFRKQGTARTVKVSTPLIAGASRIQRNYERSDMRRYYLRCLGCAALVDWDWEDMQGVEDAPDNPWVACPSCGEIHHQPQRRAMIADGMWIPTAALPAPDGQPVKPPKAIEPGDVDHWRNRDMGALKRRRGYWITGFINVFTSWSALARGWLDAKGDPDAEKVFLNTDVGHAYAVNTKTPEWESLAARKSAEFRRGEGHAGALVFILSVDVQRDGLYWRINGYARGVQQFSLDWDFLPGETAIANKGAWLGLRKIADGGAPLAGGGRWPFDGIVVDTNYNTDAAKDFVARYPNAIGINGAAGWGKPVIYRVEETALKQSGKKKRFGGQKVWHVGTFTVKNTLIASYRNTVAGPDETGLPTGYQHWPYDADDDFFKQLTSEYVDESKNRHGRITKEWKARGANHYFDCDVYAYAMLVHLRMRDGSRGHWEEADWAEREAALAAAGVDQTDLFASRQTTRPSERRSPESVEDALRKMARNNRGDS
ncbi:MAG: terminase gpA endonuclease subunit [Caulobacterales bacterium]|uniref:terminase gpA endonuclease subunit n=1 Tax=Glycocaulis sp. TaxID=1969725 RepID=UPI003FA0D353